jgi:hypothetical protein
LGNSGTHLVCVENSPVPFFYFRPYRIESPPRLRHLCVMRVWARSLILGALTALAGTANADWYSCKDPKYGGDSPPAECKGEICVTKPNGQRKCTPPPETPAQRKEREDHEKRQRECEKKAADKRRDEFGFLDKYKTEDDIQTERYRVIAEQQRLIDDAKQRLEGGKAKEAKLVKEAEFYGSKHPMPDDLQRDIDGNRQLLDLEERHLASALKGMQQINDKYDAMLKRHGDLIQNGVRTVPCNPEK